MLLKTISALMQDVLIKRVDIKYSLESIYDSANGIKVKCSEIENNSIIIFDLDDVILFNKIQNFSSQDIMRITAAFEKKRGKLEKYDQRFVRYYTIFSMWFVACLILSNLGALKLCDFFGWFQLDAGTFIFPMLYVINDVVTEIYGFQASRRMVIIALLANCLFVSVLYLITLIPSSEKSEIYSAMTILFSLSPRIFIASVFSYFIGELLNSKILIHLKEKYRGRHFAIRSVISTSISAFLESSLFCIIAFSLMISAVELVKMILVLALVKVIYEIIMLPITVQVVANLKARQKIDYIDLSGDKKTIGYA